MTNFAAAVNESMKWLSDPPRTFCKEIKRVGDVEICEEICVSAVRLFGGLADLRRGGLEFCETLGISAIVRKELMEHMAARRFCDGGTPSSR